MKTITIILLLIIFILVLVGTIIGGASTLKGQVFKNSSTSQPYFYP